MPISSPLSRVAIWVVFAVAGTACIRPSAAEPPAVQTGESKPSASPPAGNYSLTLTFKKPDKPPQVCKVIFIPGKVSVSNAQSAFSVNLEAELAGEGMLIDGTMQLPGTYDQFSVRANVLLGKAITLLENDGGTATLVIDKANKPTPTASAAKADVARAGLADFTPWMSQPKLDEYIKGLEAGTKPGEPNYWDRGHWITAVEGRWGDGDAPEYRIRYGEVPPNRGLSWYWWLNLNTDELAHMTEANLKKGMRLAYCNYFVRSDGTVFYQVIWNDYKSK